MRAKSSARNTGSRKSARGLRRAAWLLVVAAGALIALLAYLSRTGGEVAQAPAAPPPPRVELPPEMRMRFESALALVREKRFSEAIPELERLYATLEGSPATSASTSRVHASLCGALLKSGEPERALAAALRFLEKNPGDVAHNVFAGTVLFDRKLYGEAVGRLAVAARAGNAAVRALGEDPLLVRCRLGEAYRVLGRLDEARATLDAVLAEDPAHMMAVKLRAGVAIDQRDFARALELAERVYRGSAADTLVLHLLARAAVEAGRPARALEVLAAFAASGATLNEELLLWRAKAYAATGNHAEAAASAGALLLADPDRDEAYLVLANALERLGKHEPGAQCREAYTRGASLRAELEQASTAASRGSPMSSAFYRGCAYARARKLGPALAALQEARRRAPRNGEVQARLSRVLLDAEYVVDARETLATYERMCGDEGIALAPEVFLAKAEIAWTAGDARAALEVLAPAYSAESTRRDAVRLAMTIALGAGTPEAAAAALSSAGAPPAVDAEWKGWQALGTVLAGKPEEARGALEEAVPQLPDATAALWLALGMARRATGDRQGALEALRKTLAKEELLRPAWEGLKAVADNQGDIEGASRWLEGSAEVEAGIRAVWERLRGAQPAAEQARGLLTAARLRLQLGQYVRARALTALARDLDPRNAEAQRQTAILFTRPEDVFVRLRALEALCRLEPADTIAVGLRRQEYERLDFLAPSVAPQSGPAAGTDGVKQ